MRLLTKRAEPAVLAINKLSWTNDFLAALAGKRPARYREPTIKSELLLETLDRCAYCEGKIQGVGYLQVEHILPKSKFPHLVVDWANLTIACAPCNRAKGEYYEQAAPLLNPFDVTTPPQMMYAGSLVFEAMSSQAARRTIKHIGLMRADLVAARETRLNKVQLAYNAWFEAGPLDRAWLSEGIRRDVDNGEFPSAVSAFLVSHGFPL